MQQRIDPGKDDGLTAHGADMAEEARLRLMVAPLVADALRAGALSDAAALMGAASATAMREALRLDAEGAGAAALAPARFRAQRLGEQAAALQAEAVAALPVPERVAGRATIYGVVVQADGQPAVGLTVAALDAAAGKTFGFGCSGKRGAYRIDLPTKEPLRLRLQVSDTEKKIVMAPGKDVVLVSGGLLRRDLLLGRDAAPGCAEPPGGKPQPSTRDPVTGGTKTGGVAGPKPAAEASASAASGPGVRKSRPS